MHHDGENVLQIGLFSKLSLLSVRMLRHYHQHGLLEPALVDPMSGYRYYRAAQLREADRIRQLRDAGFPVGQMAELLRIWETSTTELATALAAHRHSLHTDLDQVHHKLSALDRLVDTAKEEIMTYQVTEVVLPAMTVASVRDVLPTYDQEGRLWEQLGALMGQAGAQFQPDGLGGATFHDEDFHETDVDVEVWIQVAAPFTPVPGVTCREVAEQKVVTVTFTGSYERMTQVTAAMGDYIAAKDLATGPMFNIYKVSPAQDPNPEHWVTMVCFPIVEASAS